MQFIPSSGLKGGRAAKDRLDSRKSRAVRSIAVFGIFLRRSPTPDLTRPPATEEFRELSGKTGNKRAPNRSGRGSWRRWVLN